MATAKKTPAKKASSKRELIAPKGDKRLIRRDDKGRIKESDDLGRSLAADVRTPAKKTVSSGQGDKGDAAGFAGSRPAPVGMRSLIHRVRAIERRTTARMTSKRFTAPTNSVHACSACSRSRCAFANTSAARDVSSTGVLMDTPSPETRA